MALVAISFATAYVLNAPVAAFEPRLGRVAASLIVLLAAILLVMGVVLTVATGIVSELARMHSESGGKTAVPPTRVHIATAVGETATTEATGISSLMRNSLAEHPEVTERLMEAGRDAARAAAAAAAAFAKRIGSFVAEAANLVMLPYLVFLILLEWPNVGRIVRLLPPEIHPLLMEIDAFLASFFRGQFVCSLIIAALLSTGLFTIGVEFPFFIGLLGGIANVIPYIGPVIAGIPAGVLILIKTGFTVISATDLALVALLNVAVQSVDGFILQPIFMGAATEMRPLEIILALAVGADLFGVPGLLFAIPVYGILRIVSRHVRVVFE